MSKPVLTNGQKQALRKASSAAIRQSFSQLRPHLNNNRWVGVGNRYSINTVARLKKDLGATGTINNRHLAQYIASSAPIHCTDAWTYLGRALICHARGDANTALHLAYYAELRAAMALLASEGVGLFSRQHVSIDDTVICRKIPNPQHGTHVMTWLALEHWADLRRSAESVMSVITPGSLRLSDWLEQFGAAVTTSLVTSRMLKGWGLDLKYLSEDREARNEASYRPDRLVSRTNINANTASEFLRSIWSLFEPFPSSRFETLDRHLLRATLEQTFIATTGNSVTADPAGFESRVDTMLAGVAPTGLSKADWKHFLLRGTVPDAPAVIQLAARRDTLGSPQHHMQVISRASLLLRVATGACSRLIESTAVPSAELEFWWNQIGIDIGLWDATTTPADLIDLWADIEGAVEELQTWENANPSPHGTFANWWVQLATQLSLLGTTERVALWGLGF